MTQCAPNAQSSQNSKVCASTAGGKSTVFTWSCSVLAARAGVSSRRAVSRRARLAILQQQGSVQKMQGVMVQRIQGRGQEGL